MKKLKLLCLTFLSWISFASIVYAHALDEIVRELAGNDVETLVEGRLSFSGTTLWMLLATLVICFSITNLALEVAGHFGGVSSAPIGNSIYSTASATALGAVSTAGHIGKSAFAGLKEMKKGHDNKVAAGGKGDESSKSAGAKPYEGGDGKPAEESPDKKETPDSPDKKETPDSPDKKDTPDSPDKKDTPETPDSPSGEGTGDGSGGAGGGDTGGGTGGGTGDGTGTGGGTGGGTEEGTGSGGEAGSSDSGDSGSSGAFPPIPVGGNPGGVASGGTPIPIGAQPKPGSAGSGSGAPKPAPAGGGAKPIESAKEKLDKEMMKQTAALHGAVAGADKAREIAPRAGEETARSIAAMEGRRVAQESASQGTGGFTPKPVFESKPIAIGGNTNGGGTSIPIGGKKPGES